MRLDPDRRSAGDHLAVAVDAHVLRAVAICNRDAVLNPAALALHLGVNGLAIRLLLSGRQRLLQRGAGSSWPSCTAKSASDDHHCVASHSLTLSLPDRRAAPVARTGYRAGLIGGEPCACADPGAAARSNNAQSEKHDPGENPARRAGHYGLPWLAG